MEESRVKMKVKMHTVLNRLAFWTLFPILIIASFFIYRDAASDGLRVFGLVFIAVFFLLVIYLFIFKFCLFDYAVFSDEGIALYSPFKKKAFFKYNEVNGCFAEYTSIIEMKKYLTFTNKKYDSVVTHIDTSSSGNTIAINKMQVIYVPMSDAIMDFLKEKSELQWYAKG